MTANKTKWVRLGDYIEEVDERNTEGKYSLEDVRGMTITKEIIPTKADLKHSDLSNFKVVQPKEFIYNPRTHGKKIGLGFNLTSNPFIISWNNIAFRVINTNTLVPEYLFMLFCRSEWDRNACFRSWGSSTEVFSWSALCETIIPLPPLEVQQELVATYEGLKRLAEDNEALIAPLTEACQAFIVDCKRQYPSVPLGDYIEEVDERNTEGKYSVEDVMGINIDKIFIDTKANMEGVALTPYKLVKPSEFCYVSVTSRNGGKISLAINSSEQTYIVSSSYEVFKCIGELLPEYLYMLLSRGDFDRYARFNSWGSARENFSWEELCRVQIPLPPLEVQQSIVNIYHCIEEAKSIAREARERLTTLCPALVQYAINA